MLGFRASRVAFFGGRGREFRYVTEVTFYLHVLRWFSLWCTYEQMQEPLGMVVVLLCSEQEIHDERFAEAHEEMM